LDVVADAAGVEELVELLVVDAMRALHFVVQTRRAWSDVDGFDVARLEMPVELRLELRPLSVWTTWTRNGKARRTSSMNRIAVR
jgi:hypothetical protein